MADRSLVASAYAEVRADLSKLPGDLATVPSIMKRMISTQGLMAIRDILTGNITSGLVSLVTQGYSAQAEKLRGLADAARDAASALTEEAKSHGETATALEREAKAASQVADRKAVAVRDAAVAAKAAIDARSKGEAGAGQGGLARSLAEAKIAEAAGHDQAAKALLAEAIAWDKVATSTSRTAQSRQLAHDKAERLRADAAALTGQSGGLRAQAQALLDEAKGHEALTAKLFREADTYDRLARSKEKAGAGSAGAAAEAARLRSQAMAARNRATGLTGSADEQRERAERLRKQAGDTDRAGSAMGGKVALASRVGIAAIGAIAAVATAYFATTVAAAHAATANLKTTQLIRATGEAAGWTSDQLRHMGENLRKASNFSANDISGAQQALLKHPNVKGDQFDKALKTSANLAAVFGETLPQAANELGSILAGLNDPMAVNGEMLAKYRVLLNGAQQGAIRNAIATRDWAKAQDLVLGHLSGFDGSAKEASETGVGGFEKLKNSALAAAVTIGGLNGDIGKLASRVADAIDVFMGLQIVKDILDLSTAQWRLLMGVVSEFIESNRADIEKWAGQVSEIYHNVRDQILEAWDFVKKVTQEVLASILGSFGTSWAEIKAVVTAVLDEISLLTTNFGLTTKYVWIGIQLGAQQTWDGIRDGLAAIAAAFEATWGAVAKGAEAAWAQIQEAFGGPAAKSIADEMAKGFKDGLEAGALKYKFGDSDAAKELKRQLGEVRKQMEDARDVIRGNRDDEAKRKADRDKALEIPGKSGAYINTKPFKFEFTGFEELAKKVQTSLYPTEQIQLARAGVAAAEAAVNNGMEANKKLDKIVDGLKGGLGFAP